MKEKTYLGDSVYAEATSHGVRLTTENGLPTDPSNTIFLEPFVLQNLIGFAEKHLTKDIDGEFTCHLDLTDFDTVPSETTKAHDVTDTWWPPHRPTVSTGVGSKEDVEKQKRLRELSKFPILRSWPDDQKGGTG